MYRFPMGINSFHLPPFCGRFFKYFLVGFSSGTSRIAGLGEGTPQQDLPKGQNRRYADFGTVVESCSKKVTASSVWAFADTSGGRGVDSASYAAGFLPLLLTTHGKANLAKFPGISFRVFVTEFDKNGRISSVLQ